MTNKLKGLPRIVYINLDEATDRNDRMVSMFENFGITNYSRFGTTRPSRSEHHRLSPSEYGCLMSHISIILDFAESDEDYLLVMEDDVDLSPVEQWQFTWQDIVDKAGDFDIFQLIRVKRYAVDIDLVCRDWQTNDSTTAAYVITKRYAKQIASIYKRKGVNGFKKFARYIGPVADYALYIDAKTKSTCIFWLIPYDSQVGAESHPANVVENHRQMKDIMSKPIEISDIFK